MIFGSLLLILVAVIAFGLGLAQGSNAFLVMSIGASLLAAIAIVLGARRAADVREDRSPQTRPGLDDTGPLGEGPAGPSVDRSREAGHRRGEGTVYGGARSAPDSTGTDVLVAEEPEPAASIPSQSGGSRHVELDIEPDTEEDPPDEPAAQLVTPGDAARVARMSAEVLVIDGRPRYHQAGCVHLLGRESEPLPVSEAVDLGFTPCSLCEPDSALLAEARGD
jgi:hypothetical protein